MEETELAPEDEAEGDRELGGQAAAMLDEGSARSSRKGEEEKGSRKPAPAGGPGREGNGSPKVTEAVVMAAVRDHVIKVGAKKAQPPRAGRRASRMMGQIQQFRQEDGSRSRSPMRSPVRGPGG